MYRPALNSRDKGSAIAAVIAIHAGLAFAFLHMSGKMDLSNPQQALRIFDIHEVEPPLPPPPPPPPPPVQKQAKKPKPKASEGASSPKNLKSEATPVVAPKPKIELPVPPKIAVSETPRQGTGPTQGASDVRGPGTGAGGIGTGTGSGGAGRGAGGGGEGTRPRLLSRPLTSRDYPRELLRDWPKGARVMVAVRVQLDGRATDCKINGSSGIQAIDLMTCRLVETKLRFRPAMNDKGEPYVAWYGYMQYPVNF